MSIAATRPVANTRSGLPTAIKHLFACDNCGAERVWGCTETREGKEPRDYREVTDPLLGCDGCTPTGGPMRFNPRSEKREPILTVTPHTFQRYVNVGGTE